MTRQPLALVQTAGGSSGVKGVHTAPFAGAYTAAIRHRLATVVPVLTKLEAAWIPPETHFLPTDAGLLQTTVVLQLYTVTAHDPTTGQLVAGVTHSCPVTVNILPLIDPCLEVSGRGVGGEGRRGAE